jgi:hypothetical protein
MNTDITVIFPNYGLAGFLGEEIKEILTKEQWIQSPMELRSALSISKEISKRLRAKAISKEGSNKPIKMKLPYEYAHALFLILKNVGGKLDIDPEDFYTENAIQTLINDLHQKLI